MQCENPIPPKAPCPTPINITSTTNNHPPSPNNHTTKPHNHDPQKMDLTPTPTTTKRYTRRDSDAPELASLPLRPPSTVYTTDAKPKPTSRVVSFQQQQQPHDYTIPRSDPDYGSTRRRSAFRRSKTFWVVVVLVMAMSLAVGVGIGYAVGVNGARVVVHTPESVGQATRAQP